MMDRRVRMRLLSLLLLLCVLGLPPSTLAEEGPIQTKECPPPPDTLDCTAKMECSKARDQRECNTCLIRNPFGGCIARGNDPACEAAKASQNSIYDAQRAACEAQKAQQKLSCEQARAALKARFAACNETE